MQYNEASDAGLGPEDYKVLHAEVLRFGGYRQGALRRLPASQFTSSWLKYNGTFRAVLIPAVESGQGPEKALVATPPTGLTPEYLSATLGPLFQVQTFDIPSQQEGPIWTLHQWAMYWKRRTGGSSSTVASPNSPSLLSPTPATATAAALENDLHSKGLLPAGVSTSHLVGIHSDFIRRLFSCPSLPINGTVVAKELSTPAAIQAVDVRHTLLGLDTAAEPSPMKLGMFPSKSFLNTNMAPGGASLWVHLVSGTVTLALTPPSPRNLATYAAWAARGPRNKGNVFLPSRCEGVARADLVAGDTLIVPPGWSFTLAVTSAAVTVSGVFLRGGDSIAVHLDAMRIEECVGVQAHCRYPEMKQLMWKVAERYTAALANKAVETKGLSLENFEQKIAVKAAEMEREDRVVAEKAAVRARAAAQAQAAAAAAAAATAQAELIAGAAGRRGARPVSVAGAHAGQKRRRRSPTTAGTSFIESESEEEDDYDSIRRSQSRMKKSGGQKKGGGGGGGGDEFHAAEDLDYSEEEEDEEDDDDDDDESDLEDEFGVIGGRKKKSRKTKTTAAAAAGGGLKGTRVSTRVRSQPSSKRRDNDYDDDDDFGGPPLATVAPIKLKIKLPTTTTTASPAVAPLPLPLHSPPIKLKLKFSSSKNVPQVDGPADDDDDDDEDDEIDIGGTTTTTMKTTTTAMKTAQDVLLPCVDDLSEGEEQGLAALTVMLRRWLREASPSSSSSSPPPVAAHWEVLARLELSLKVLGLPTTTPLMCTNLSAVAAETLELQSGVNFQEKWTLAAVEKEVLGDVGTSTVPAAASAGGRGVSVAPRSYGGSARFQIDNGGGGDESGDNGAIIEESDDPPIAAAAAFMKPPLKNSGGGVERGGSTPATNHQQQQQQQQRPSAAKKPAGKAMKKLSTKDRLKKKLGL